MFKKIALTLACFTSATTIQAKQHFTDVLACHTHAEHPGIAVRLEQAGKLVYQGANGIADLNSKRALSSSDVFQIGSVTKQFTAAAILLLVEQGKLSLQDSVAKIIPEINSDYAGLKIMNLLSHTAGLGDYFGVRRVSRRWDEYANSAEIIKQISRIDPVVAPGAEFRYSNIGYLLLGRIIEITADKSYAQFLQDNVFKPLAMTKSRVIERGFTDTGIVPGHSANRRKPGKFMAPEAVDRSWIGAAGAIASTLEDLAKWHQALRTGKVISQENYQLMVKKALLNSGETINYGMGFNIFPIQNLLSYSHDGGVPGYMVWTVYFPDKDLFAAAFSNNESQHPGPALLDMISMQLGLTPEPIAQVQKLSLADRLVGKYRFEDGTTTTISFDGEHLYAKSKGQDKRQLVARENDSFSYTCTQDFFKLVEDDGKTLLTPVSMFFGEGTPAIKL